MQIVYRNRAGVSQAILPGQIDFKRDPWPKVSKHAKGLFWQMLEPDPKIQLTTQQVLIEILI